VEIEWDHVVPLDLLSAGLIFKHSFASDMLQAEAFVIVLVERVRDPDWPKKEERGDELAA
jgi:hypothetical protein